MPASSEDARRSGRHRALRGRARCCGSTLVEGILASHPEVHAIGESAAFGEAVRALGAHIDYPELMRQVGPAELERVARGYLAAIHRGAPAGSRTTDTMLANRLFLGLIHAALPDARILYVHRDPVEICLSCFQELFTPDQPFCYDLGELGRFCHANEVLMGHWQQVLPARVLLRVNYKELMAQFDVVAHRLLTHCGLGWDERVRERYRTRHVATASLPQARQRLDRRAHWRPDEAALAPLMRGLAGEP